MEIWIEKGNIIYEITYNASSFWKADRLNTVNRKAHSYLTKQLTFPDLKNFLQYKWAIPNTIMLIFSSKNVLLHFRPRRLLKPGIFKKQINSK